MLPGEVLQAISIVRAAVNESVCEDSHTEHMQFASAAVSTFDGQNTSWQFRTLASRQLRTLATGIQYFIYNKYADCTSLHIYTVQVYVELMVAFWPVSSYRVVVWCCAWIFTSLQCREQQPIGSLVLKLLQCIQQCRVNSGFIQNPPHQRRWPQKLVVVQLLSLLNFQQTSSPQRSHSTES